MFYTWCVLWHLPGGSRMEATAGPSRQGGGVVGWYGGTATVVCGGMVRMALT